MKGGIAMLSQINKAILAPLASGIFLLIKQIFGIEITEPEQEVYVNAVLSAIALAGIFMQFKK